MQMKSGSLRFTVTRSFGAPGMGENPTNRCCELTNNQIAFRPLVGLMFEARTDIVVPLGYVDATLLQPVKSGIDSVGLTTVPPTTAPPTRYTAKPVAVWPAASVTVSPL